MTTPAASPYALCGLQEVRELLGYQDGDTKRDNTIQRAINAISAQILKRSQRWFIIPAGDNVTTKPRFFQVTQGDVDRGWIRTGDFNAAPSEVAMLSPDRNNSDDPIVLDSADYWTLPDFPEPGDPYTALKVISTAVRPLTVGYWLRVKSTHWGYAAVPEDMVECAVACAAAWVLNDPQKQSEMAQAAGRRLSLPNIILPEWEEAVDNYRVYRVT